MTARLSLIVKTSSAMGFAHYSTARKIAPAMQVRFSNAVPYRSVVFTIKGVQINARLRPPLHSGRRLAEQNALPAYACGNARRRVLSLGEDATPAMLSAEPSEPLRSRPSSRLQASPPRHPPRRQIIRSDCPFDCIGALSFMHSSLRYHITFISDISVVRLEEKQKVCKGSPPYGVSKGQAAYAVRFAEP